MSNVLRNPDGMRYVDDLQVRIERLERAGVYGTEASNALSARLDIQEDDFFTAADFSDGAGGGNITLPNGTPGTITDLWSLNGGSGGAAGIPMGPDETWEFRGQALIGAVTASIWTAFMARFKFTDNVGAALTDVTFSQRQARASHNTAIFGSGVSVFPFATFATTSAFVANNVVVRLEAQVVQSGGSNATVFRDGNHYGLFGRRIR